MLVKCISDVVHAGTLAVSLQCGHWAKPVSVAAAVAGGASPITVTQLASWKILTLSFPSAGKSFDHTLYLYLFICLTVAFGWRWFCFGKKGPVSIVYMPLLSSVMKVYIR